MTPQDARAAFAALVAQEEPHLDLARAALYIAAEEYPGLDVEGYLTRLHTMAEEAAARPLEAPPPLGRLLALNRYLFTERGFHGNTASYYDPRNSFLNEVLDRRTGLPITLAIVYLEVAWRLELPVAGVGMPSHFLVGYYGADPPRYIDVFHRGALLSREDCAARLRVSFGEAFLFRDEHLAPVTKRQILTRVLTNLKYVYHRQEDWGRALGVIERLLLLQPDAPAEVRDRGVVHLRRGALRAARADLERYMRLAPRANDLRTVREQLALIDRLLVLRN
ncbi:MAG TPA: transglutaminase-like domain-containing protein [Chloroflexota bacterium]|nr:transglutaminase-like domain-containing protein [Chloroflexota bacterium]